jgi:hypothetical protein
MLAACTAQNNMRSFVLCDNRYEYMTHSCPYEQQQHGMNRKAAVLHTSDTGRRNRRCPAAVGLAFNVAPSSRLCLLAQNGSVSLLN